MGGELGAQPVGGGAPTLAITALRDPQGAHLQRVQVIKGTLGVDGTPRVQVFDVYGDRGIGRDVNLSTCEPSSAGSDQICTTFRDPTFDPREHAYYYVRVLGGLMVVAGMWLMAWNMLKTWRESLHWHEQPVLAVPAAH